MAPIHQTLLVPQLCDSPALPRLSAVLARVVTSVATAVVAPAVLFAATAVLANVATAMIVALGWLAGAVAWRRSTGRPVSGLLMLTIVIMSVKTAITFATGNTFIYFVQPVVVDAVVATLFLASWQSDRPFVSRLAPDFCPLHASLAARPRIRQLFRGLTLMWGLVILVKGVVTLWLLLTLSTVDFIVIKGSVILALTLTTIAATVMWSVIVCRQEGLLGPARDASSTSPQYA
jgi:intracellular septation protein A